MVRAYTKAVNTRRTPQTEVIPGREKVMVANSAGGVSFQLDDWGRLRRFLVLGAEGGTYYIGERKLVLENVASLRQCLAADPLRTIQEIVKVSSEGRAPKNDPAIFALAVAAADANPSTRQLACAATEKVCRTGTHRFQFLEAVQGLRGWGPSLIKAVRRWYEGQDADKLAFQMLKYAQRNGWSQRDVLRLAHPKAGDDRVNALFKYVASQGEIVPEEAPALVHAAEAIKVAQTEKEAAKLISKHNLPRELVPTQFLNSVVVWDALLESMPLTAMIRNLNKMTSIGLIKPLSSAAKLVTDRLADREHLRGARVHPLNLLVAMDTYGRGRGIKGDLSWTPVPQIVSALDDAFYKAFDTIEPTGKRWYLGIDVSGSMTCGEVAGLGQITPNKAAAAMAMVTARTEKQYAMYGFCTAMKDLGITAKDSLEAAMRKTHEASFGGTDCAQPMVDALRRKLEVDVFVIYTDNETWAGGIHPSQALQEYRRKMGIPAKLIVVGMTSNGFTIADPHDAGMLDIVGFDTSAPAVMADFATDRR